ncbi:phage tail tape measure protein [Paenibacillus anseongense]|uniref:phage tail tape measure protein n=1 Tax=Paenibacillus anseongense TaxID=2682845 RepID=UPI002DB726FE|nr:phage tail tape measure protein [Paenibacillus anseongense]MEC0269056.1 phage tail tape measure protein [Paenibacillus anseongense]
MSREYEIAFRLGAQLQSTFSQSFTQANNSIAELEKRMQKLEQTSSHSSSKKGGLGGALGGIGLAAVGATAAIGTAALVAGGAAFSMAENYQVAMAHLQQSTGASAEQMGEFKDVATSMYNMNLGESWDDLSDAISKTSSITKLHGKELQETTTKALYMRDVFGQDIPETLKASDTMMRNFGISSDQAFNLLASGAQKGLDKSGELLDSANEYAPQFKALGFSADEMFDTFSSGLDAGAFNLDKVGDAVKEFNIRAKDGSKTSAQAFQALGLNAEKMTQTFAKGGPEAKKSFTEVLNLISNVEDPVKRNAIGVSLLGTQFEDLEVKVISAMGNTQKQFDSTKDTMGEIAKVKYTSLGGAIRGIGRQFETSLVIPLSDKLLPVMQNISNSMFDVMPAIKSSLGQVGSFIGAATSEIAADAAWIWENGFDKEMEGVTINYAKALGLNDSQAEVIASSIANVFHKLGDLRDKFLTLWSEVLPYIQPIFSSVGSIMAQLIPIMGEIMSTMVTMANKIYSALIPVATYLLGKFMPIFANIASFIATMVVPSIAQAIHAIMPHILSLTDKIMSAFTTVWNIIQPIIDALVAVFNYAFPTIKSTVVNAIQAISGAIGGIFDMLGGVIDFVTGVFTGDWGKAWLGVREIFGGIFSTLGSLLAFPINNIIDAINRVIQGMNNIKFDLPEWLGGGSFDLNIPELSKIGGYADGGVVNSPELAWVGEGGDSEVIVPINNSERSRSLWQTAGSMLGMTPSTQGSQGEGSNISVTYAPVNNFYGNVDRAQVEAAQSENNDDLQKRLQALQRQQRRVAFG